MALVSLAAPLALVIYLLLVIDARRKDSPAADDDQLGIKTVAAALVVVGAAVSSSGLHKLLHLLLTFTSFGVRIKAAIPDLAVGILAIIAALYVLFPKTNVAEYPKAKRLAAGAIAVPGALATVATTAGFLSAVLEWSSWSAVAEALTAAVVAIVYFGASTMALAKMSGLSVPDIQAPAEVSQQAQQPPQQQGQVAMPAGQHDPYAGQGGFQQPDPQQAQQQAWQQQQQQQQQGQQQQGYPQQGQWPGQGQ